MTFGRSYTATVILRGRTFIDWWSLASGKEARKQSHLWRVESDQLTNKHQDEFQTHLRVGAGKMILT